MPAVSGSRIRPVSARRSAADGAQINRQKRDQRNQCRTVKRRHGIGAPDRGLSEQFRRNERRRREPFLPGQQTERDQADGEHGQRHRQRVELHALHLFERQDDRADEEDEQHQSRRIERGAAAVALARRNAKHEQHREQSERNVDEKDRLPAERLCQIAAGDRAESVGADRDAGKIALIAAAFARRDRFADQSLRQSHQAAAAEPLQHAERGEKLDIGRQRAKHGAHHEQRQRQYHHQPAAERVAEPAVNRRRDGIGDQVGNHHPRDALDFAQARGNGRQRGGDDGLIRDRHKHRQHDRRKDGQELRAGRGCLDLRPRRIRWRGGRG